MIRPTLLLPLLALATLLTGCVGVGPNTQQGAVTGGALGALAGAIIGHNSRGGDTLGGAIIGGTVGAIAGGTMGNSVDHQRGTLYGYPDQRAYRRMMVQAAPPPPPDNAETVPPSPAPDALWVPGYWSFDGATYAWMSGHWEIPPPNANAYVAAHWEYQGGGYVFVRSYWR